MKLDGFDYLNIFAAAALAFTAIAVGMTGGEGHATGAVSVRVRSASVDPGLYPKLTAARTLLEAGQVKESVAALDAIAKQHPADAEAHALLGQAYSRHLDYPRAMKEFRLALMLDPDYVDKRSAKFIGKRIKAAVKEGMAESKAALSKDPADEAARASLKDAYYLERMLAGGCE